MDGTSLVNQADGRSSVAPHDVSGPLQNDERPAVKNMAIVFLSMFQAYATMQNLQRGLKADMGVEQTGERAAAFTWAVTMLHIGKLISRLAHNIVCSCWAPLTRVYISMWFIVFGSGIPAIFILWMKSDWIGWVSISYLFVGCGIGIFEATFLAVITPMGKKTKSCAILGIPAGFLTIGVPGVLLLGAGAPAQALYLYVVFCTIGSMFIIYRSNLHTTLDEDNCELVEEKPSLWLSLLAWRSWLPLLIPHLVGKMFVNFGMENLFPVIIFTFNGDQVPLFGPASNVLLSKSAFQAIQNILVFFGDSLSRRIPYCLPMKRSSVSLTIILFAMMCEIVGMLLMKTAIAWVAWLAISLAFFGNGLVYAVGSKHIDQHVPKEHHLAAYSTWCFFGDISSVVGAKSQDLVRSWICGDIHSAYECLAK